MDVYLLELDRAGLFLQSRIRMDRTGEKRLALLIFLRIDVSEIEITHIESVLEGFLVGSSYKDKRQGAAR